MNECNDDPVRLAWLFYIGLTVIRACKGSFKASIRLPSLVIPVIPDLKDPLPRIMILHLVSSLIFTKKLPLGPSNNPTKLICGCS
jgi:hypothetical protein